MDRVGRRRRDPAQLAHFRRFGKLLEEERNACVWFDFRVKPLTKM